MPIRRVLTSCFGGGVSPSVSGDGPGTTASSTASANAPAAGGAVEFLRGVESRHHPSHVKTRTLPLVARGSEDPSDARDSGCSTAESPVAQIQRILAACSTTPSGPGPLSTLSRSALNAFCQSLDVPLALVVFEDAADTELQAQHSSGLTVEAARSGGAFTSFEMQAHPWHFMFKVRCVWVNGATVQALGAGPMDAAIQHISTTANKNTAMRCDLMGLLKGIEHGQSQAVKTWNTYYQNKDMDLAALWLQPCLWSTADGSRFIACLIHTEPQPSQATLLKAMAQDHMCLESIPYSVTTVTEQGMICSQNAAARASFGAFLSVLHGGQGVNFLEELFYGHPDLRAKMHRQLQCASSFQVCIQLLSPLLRDWLNLEDGDEVWHQLYITRVAGAGPQDPAYVIVQPDITDMVITERKVAQLQQQHQGLLKEILPPEVMEAILHSKMMQDAAPAARGRDAQDLGMYLEESERECEDADSATMPTSRSSHQLMQLTSSGAQHPAMLRSAPRGRRTSQLVVNETQSTLNATLMASQEALVNHGVPSASISQLSGDKKGIWLTQQDVQNLATNHESVTILFADIKGFTALSQTLHPAEVMLFLNQLYSIWDAMLDSYGVYKVETIGDSYMVAGGLFSIDPESKLPKLGGYDPRHAQKVLDFGRAMLESAALVVDPRGDPVQIRIGIHSGACVSGVVGQRMPRFCLFGDTINTASRMESTCPRPGCIHASGASQALLNHEPWVPTGGVFCKGKGIMQSFYLHVSAESMTAEELAEEQRLLLPASLLIAGASEAPSEQAMADDLSRAHSSLQHNTGPGAHLAASSSSHLGGTGSSLVDAQVASLASYAQLPGLEQLADEDEMWDARSRDDPSTELVPTCSGLERSLMGSASFISARNTPLGAPSCSGASDMSSQGSRGGLASKPLTRLASHSGQLPVPCSSCAEDPSDALPLQGVRVRAHIKAHGEHPAASASGALSTLSRADLSQTSHATAVCMEPQGPFRAPLGPLGEPIRLAASTSQPQHTLQSSSLTTSTAPNTWPVMNAQMGVAGYDLSQDLLAGHSMAAGGHMNRHDCVPQSMSCTFRRNSPTSPPKVPLPSVAEGPLPPITPAATPAGRKDNNNWKVTSNDGRARGPGQGTGHRPHLGRLSTVAEQAQRVLQELHQSRPRPREFSKPMNVNNFDRRGSIDVYRRGSMDVRRVGSDVPHRGSLDLAWATVEKFRRSQSPRPTVVHEYPEQSSGSFAI